MHPATLKLFLEVADLGSFSKAAIARRTVQSHISRQISDLERECGLRLFRRTGRGVVLTELGERIVPRVRTWLAETDQLVNDIKSSAEVPVGEVRIGILPSAAHPLVTTVYERARERYPRVRLSVREGQGAELDGLLDSGAVDLAILFRYEKSARGDEQHLATVNTFLVGGANDEITRPETIDFSRLDRLPLILPSRPSPWRHLLDGVSRRKGISLLVVLEADSVAIQKEVTAKGGTYTVLGPYAMMEDVRAGRLQASRIVNPDLKRFVTLAMPKKGPLTLACKAVAQLIRETATELEGEGALRLGRNAPNVRASAKPDQPGKRSERSAKFARR
jgi:LysR family transcriptional regulator, nitrogen assimilation regulatory protein